MKDHSYRRAWHAVQMTLCASLGSAACVIEKIDAIIAEHGVTYWPSSSGDESGHVAFQKAPMCVAYPS